MGGWLFAAPVSRASDDLDLDAKVRESDLARYSELGSALRYKTLIESLRKPISKMGAPARDLRLPVRSFEDGRPQTTVHAKEAWITLDTNYLRGRQVVVTQFNEDGSVNALLTADELAVDRTTMLAVAKGKVRGEMGGDVLTGVGALADLNNKYLRIVKRAVITTKRMGEVKLTDRGIF